MASVKITRLTPKTLKTIPNIFLEWGTAPTNFGKCLGAFHNDALCYLSFYDTEAPLDDLKATWSTASLTENQTVVSTKLQRLFEDDSNIEVYLKGTDFEIEVWEALLKIQKGATVSYEDVAKGVGRPRAVRAAARAVAKNCIGYFVPCHRVIKKDGSLHRYGGGPERKKMMLKYEGAI